VVLIILPGVDEHDGVDRPAFGGIIADIFQRTMLIMFVWVVYVRRMQWKSKTDDTVVTQQPTKAWEFSVPASPLLVGWPVHRRPLKKTCPPRAQPWHGTPA
jgi:hypothetical protein